MITDILTKKITGYKCAVTHRKHKKKYQMLIVVGRW